MAEKSKSAMSSVVETIKTIVYALLIAGIFRTFFFQPFWIPSGSMKDTLLIGDFLFVNKMAYGYSYASCPSIIAPGLGIDIGADDFCGFATEKEDRLLGRMPERGDVVVFRHPVTGRDFIKRLIGLPGDTVQMQGGQLFLNGDAVPQQDDGLFRETYEAQGPQGLRPRCANGAVGEGGECVKPRTIETLPNGVSYATLDIGEQALDDTGVYTVPEGHFFFMGDNRDNSTDSRVPQNLGGVGFVPLKDIVGRADRVVFSSAGRSLLHFWTWRGDRFFKAI
ncbi:signal peptidase I [Poseidonocella sedimentorum]|uniref:Signal peptidase I n=1 Tax=Poseidonocella sedimentorum TaxID=871652 RepID=A0A1I6D3E1_9RHOB|nr:signal peptidase I [Poseidonocella sedimentorum]SFQ99852.1 signal peptidase I [Poseidonocella sedimentorum]